MDTGSLKNIEQKAYQSYFTDGLWDIFFGMFLLASAVSPVLEALHLPQQLVYVFLLLSPLVLILGRKYITIPRMVLVKFGTARKARRVILLVMTLFLVSLTFFLWLLLALGKNYVPAVLKMGPHPWLAWTVEALFLTSALWLVAYFLQFTRLYLYGILVGLGYPLSELLRSYTGQPLNAILAYGLPGCLIITFGLFMLIRFLINYPLRDAAELDNRETGTADMQPISNNPLPEIDRLIHEPARLLIMANLYFVESADFLFLMNQTVLTQGNLSSHLTRLEEGGYLEIKKEFIGRRPYTKVSITGAGKEAFDRYSVNIKKLLT